MLSGELFQENIFRESGNFNPRDTVKQFYTAKNTAIIVDEIWQIYWQKKERVTWIYFKNITIYIRQQMDLINIGPMIRIELAETTSLFK